jgi:hypothetical protein
VQRRRPDIGAVGEPTGDGGRFTRRAGVTKWENVQGGEEGKAALTGIATKWIKVK